MTDDIPEESADKIDIHDLDVLRKLWFMVRDSANNQEIFAIMALLIDSLPYDWLNHDDSWLHIAQQLDYHGEAELASIFKLANQRAFQLSLKEL